MNTLSSALKDAQDKCIGLFRSNWSKRWNPVIEEGGAVLTCIHVGDLLGLITDYQHIDYGEYVKFPDGKTLTEMMLNPFEFSDWYNKNITLI